MPDTDTTPAATTAGRKKRVLITGAGGRIGTSLTGQLGGRYDLRLNYYPAIPEQPPAADVSVANAAVYEEIAPAMQGMDAVIHLAGEPSTRASWESVRTNNIEATYNVLEAARQAGVKRVVFASTNHVMGMYDRDRQWPVYVSQPIRPDSLYGVSKAFGEALGRHYYDQYGLSVICLRIGWFLPEPRDCAQVVWRAIESEVGFGIFYAISANSGRHWDITETMEKLGYRPQDDAEAYAAQLDALRDAP